MSEFNPIAVMEQCGRTTAKHPEFLDHFCYSFGQALLNNSQISERIDFLTDHSISEPTVQNGNVAGVRWLYDTGGDFRHLAVVLLCDEQDDNFYSVRPFTPSLIESSQQLRVEATIELEYSTKNFWNFYYHKKIRIEQPCKPFLDLHNTRALVNLLVWTSNVSGFLEKEKP